MPLDYETPPPAAPLSRGRRRARRVIAMSLLGIGLFFGLGETAVFVLGMLAVGSFDDMRHLAPAARFEQMTLVGVVAVAGYGLAAAGFFLDPSRKGKPAGHK